MAFLGHDITPIRHLSELGEERWQPRIGNSGLQDRGGSVDWAGIGGAGAVLFRSRKKAQRYSERYLRRLNKSGGGSFLVAEDQTPGGRSGRVPFVNT